MITIMVALHCEAKPIIDAYRLKKKFAKPFDYYVDSAQGVELVITGIGALAMAAAVGWVGANQTDWLDSDNQDKPRAWLNVGTAGHTTRNVGDIFLVHGAGDEVQQRCHYPSLVAKWAGQTDAVLSVSVPSSEYPGGAAVDMEAYAYFTSALRFSDSELVQSLKVVSDNQEFGFELLDAAKLTALITDNIATIQSFIEALQAVIPNPFNVTFDFDALFQLRGTHSQRLQVRELAQKLQVMKKIESTKNGLAQCTNLKEVVNLLRSELAASVPSLSSVSREG